MSDDIFIKKLGQLHKDNKISEKYYSILSDFYICYNNAVQSHISKDQIDYIFHTLLKLLLEQTSNPYSFKPYHEKITHPFNYQKFGIDFLNPLVDRKNSKVFGLDNVKKMKEYIDKKENIILLANHQSEVDPILINIFLSDDFSDLASDIIFVAGERVITDPIAIPFSMGCNLLCIYSKRYINIDLKLKHQKQIHNKKIISLMSSLLSDGGKIIYVAPSGGRDRKNEDGKIKVAPFDPQSLEMFYLMCKKAKKPSHFFPLTLATYEIMPPPEKIQIEMGEKRIAKRCPIFLSFLKELDMEHFPGDFEKNKIKRRKNRAKYIHNIVKEEYERITKGQ